MQPQLALIVSDFEKAQERLHRLVSRLLPGRWERRPAADRWSAAECVAHLNLTGQVYVPLLTEALEEGQRMNGPPPTRFRRDFAGAMLGMMTGPMPRLGRFRFGRVRTPPKFVPHGVMPVKDVMAEFDRLQAEQIALTRAAEGLPLEALRIVSPFNERLRYNVYSCLVVLPRHQHRHLEQAEEAAEA